MRPTLGWPRVLAVTVVLVLGVEGCGGGGGTEAGARPDAKGPAAREDGDHPTPAQAAPEPLEGCPAGAERSASAAAQAWAATPAWGLSIRERVGSFADVVGMSRGSVTGTVQGVVDGERLASVSDQVLGNTDGLPSARFTAHLLVSVGSTTGEMRGKAAGGSTVAVPLVLWDGSVAGLREEDVRVAIDNYVLRLDCAMPRARVTVVGTLSARAVPGATAVVELPQEGWLPDPAAVMIEAGSGTARSIASLDPLLPPGQARRFYGATTLDAATAEVAASLG